MYRRGYRLSKISHFLEVVSLVVVLLAFLITASRYVNPVVSMIKGISIKGMCDQSQSPSHFEALLGSNHLV